MWDMFTSFSWTESTGSECIVFIPGKLFDLCLAFSQGTRENFHLDKNLSYVAQMSCVSTMLYIFQTDRGQYCGGKKLNNIYFF